jgi:hypothetical protein
MRTSEQIDQLIPAMVKARQGFGVFAKDNTAKVESQKGGYSYKYGDLASLFEATVPALLANGLLLTQATEVDEQGFCLITRVAHVSGQWMESRFPLRVYDRTQETGSLLTYVRRYAAQALLGVAAEEDDDGAAAHAADRIAKPIDSVWMVAASVEAVDTKPTTKPGVTKYTVKLSTGETVGTISEKLGKACVAAMDAAREYQIELKQTQWGVDIKSLKPLAAPVSPAAHLAAPASASGF